MKSFFTALAGGVLGGLIILFGVKLAQSPTAKPHFVANKRLNQKPMPDLPSIDLTTAVEKARHSVVHISTKLDPYKERERSGDWFFGFPFYSPVESTGSGVIIAENGYIVTNNHVVEQAKKIKVTLADNRNYEAIIVGTYPQADIAVLKIDAFDLPTLEYADADAAKVGQWVLAMGHPLELKFTVTAGIISAKNRDIGILDGTGNGSDKLESFIQTDAAVNPGNSGGALIDQHGALLGINTAIASKSGYYQGYSFAIPVNTMRRIVSDIIQYGKFKRPFLGVDVFDLDEDFIAQKEITKTNTGVVVDLVVEDSPAARSGIQKDDIIVAIDDQNIRNIAELSGRISNYSIDQEIKLSVLRGNKIQKISVKLVEK